MDFYEKKLKRLSQQRYTPQDVINRGVTKSSGGRFYTKEDINLMPVDELKSKWNDINQQNKVYGIPSANQAKNYTQSGELVFVNDTTPRYEINIDNSTNQPKLQQGTFKNGSFNNFQPEQNNHTNPLVNNVAEIINAAKPATELPKQVNMPKVPNAQGLVPYREEDPDPYRPDTSKYFPLFFGDIFKSGNIEDIAAADDEAPEPEPTPDEPPKPEPTPDESKPTPSDGNNGTVLKGRVIVNDGKFPPSRIPGDDEESAMEKQKLDELASKFYENYGTPEMEMPVETMPTSDYYRTPPAPIQNDEAANSFYKMRQEAPQPTYNDWYNPYTQYVYGYDDSLSRSYNKSFEAQRPQNSGYRPPAEPVFYPQTQYDPSQEPGFDFENYARQQPQISENTYQQMLESKYGNDWLNRASSANDGFLYNNLLSNRYSNNQDNTRQTGADEKFGPTDKISLMDFLTELKNKKERQKQKKEIIDPMLNEFVDKENVPMEYRNALRHRAGSALMSNMIDSPSKARLWGNLKEMGDLSVLKENDTRTDLSNNELGRRLYKQYPNLSNEELLKKVYKDIQENPDVPKDYKDTLFLEVLWNSLGNFNALGYPIMHRKK